MKPKLSRLLFITIFILIILSVAATYYKTIVLRDFVIINDVDESAPAE